MHRNQIAEAVIRTGVRTNIQLFHYPRDFSTPRNLQKIPANDQSSQPNSEPLLKAP